MKKLILSAKFTLLFFAAQAQVTGSHSPMEDIVNAIRTDRMADMVKYFDVFVPITINNNQQVYSHNQAQIVLQDFFDKNSSKDFTINDNGSPDNNSKFLIGSFTEPTGIKYSVYILLKMKNGDYMLQEIRLNKE
jgi:hypothetical protein